MYDEMGLEAVKNNASMNMGGDNPFDMFSNIFGEMNRGSSFMRQRKTKGKNRIERLNVNLEDLQPIRKLK